MEKSMKKLKNHLAKAVYGALASITIISLAALGHPYLGTFALVCIIIYGIMVTTEDNEFTESYSDQFFEEPDGYDLSSPYI